MSIQEKMRQELYSKKIFDQARAYAFDYIEGLVSMDVFPQKEALRLLSHFDEPFRTESTSTSEILKQLHLYGSPNTTAQIGGRYFGFVNGGAVPAALASKWLTDIWDQNGGLYYTSAINAKLEQVCELWLKEIFNLPNSTVAGFVSGTSTANLCAIAAARYHLLKKLEWDVNENGLAGSPPFRIIAHKQVHSSIKKTFALLGLGKKRIEWIPSDNHGRIRIDALPELDETCLIILQAGNVNTGAFDDFDKVCTKANKAGAWVHIDGAFGLWAAASQSLSHLTKGIEKATSWAVDGHKTLNTPYDCGIVLCKEKDALISAMQASGDYIVRSDKRESMFYSNEMSKRARAIELWATLKYLGKDGIDEMVTGFNTYALLLANKLKDYYFEIINDVVFNQVLIKGKTDEETNVCLKNLQESGTLWLGGSKWMGQDVIRVSICSWFTNEEDIEKTVEAFVRARDSKD
ncbi:MAG: aminotransferase class V-fold PLP-dependent enzyme [Bacteroidota bacterium]